MEKRGREHAMKIHLPSAVESALSLLTAQGFAAYAVGGCVRDSLLGREPHDWDITTAARPEDMLAIFEGFSLVPTGLKHGTLTVHIDEMPIEITTFRVDGGYSDHRHPDAVRFSPHLADDLSRRDFTVNAMAYHPQVGLVDFFGGREDLRLGLIRCVGDPRRRFSEDALRILRALRFSSALGFSIEDATAAALHKLRGLLKAISAERVREELLRLITGENCLSVLLTSPDILGVWVPELLPCVGLDQHNPHHDFDLYTHMARAVSFIRPTQSLRMAMLLHDIGKPRCFTRSEDGVGHAFGHEEISAQMADTILRNLRFSTAQREQIVSLIRHHGLDIPTEAKTVRRWLSRLGEEGFFDILDIRRADIRAQRRNPDPDRLAHIDALEDCARKQLQERPCLSLRDLAVGGRDLMALGLPAGPQLGGILKELLSAVIDGELPNQKEALLLRAHALWKQGS